MVERLFVDNNSFDHLYSWPALSLLSIYISAFLCAADDLLTQKATPPAEEEFVDIFQKVKYSLSLLVRFTPLLLHCQNESNSKAVWASYVQLNLDGLSLFQCLLCSLRIHTFDIKRPTVL